MDQHTEGKYWSTVPNTTRIISCIAWDSLVVYPSWEYNFHLNILEECPGAGTSQDDESIWD